MPITLCHYIRIYECKYPIKSLNQNDQTQQLDLFAVVRLVRLAQ